MKILSRILAGIAAILLLAACGTAYDESDVATYDDDTLCDYHAAYIRRTVRSAHYTARTIENLRLFPIDGARCDDDSCGGGVVMRGLADGTTEILSVCERFILINGHHFISSLGNTWLPDLTTMSALEAFVGSIYSREMTNTIMTDLTVPSWHWGEFSWLPVPTFIEVEGVLFSWERTSVGDISGWRGPWSEGYIHIENAEIVNDVIHSFSVIVNERSYFLPEVWWHPDDQTLLRLTFVREGGVMRIDSIEEVSHPYSYRFETFVTLGALDFAINFFDSTESAFVLFGDETDDATLDFFDKIIDLSIATGQTIHYFNMNRFAFAFDIPLFNAVLEGLDVTAATPLPKLIYIHESGFDVVYNSGGRIRLDEFFADKHQKAIATD